MKKLLDRHGFAFQRAVEEKVKEITHSAGYGWSVHTTEFPVETRGRTTRIDLLLQQGPTWAVVECKRVDPAFAWYFAKGGSTLSHQVMIEEFEGDGDRVLTGHDQHSTGGGRPYHIALVGKSETPGDGSGAGRNQIEDAATQVLSGVSGLVNFFAEEHQESTQGDRRWIIPAIVTTANLFTTDQDISQASLTDGLLVEEVEVLEKGWLWYQYQRSPHLEPELEASSIGRTPREANRYRYARTIAVVNSEHLSDFLWNSL